MLLRHLERLIDPFCSLPDTQPPANVRCLYTHFLREVHGVFASLLLVGSLGAPAEIVLFDFFGRTADVIRAVPGAEFFGHHRSELLQMAFVVLIARLVIFGLHDAFVRQVISPNLSNLIRWQNHRYMFKQSLIFFQNDFTGRVV